MPESYDAPEPEPLTIEGRCLCGAISYRMSGNSYGIIHCHCQRCRKHSGAVVQAFVIFESGAEHTWLSGRELRGHYTHDLSRRSFCRHCGSTMPNRSGIAGNCLNLGSVQHHWYLYTASRAPWTVIPEDVEQWETAIEPPDVPELNRSTDPDWITGSCLCGKVSYAARTPVRMMNCHCSRCRLSRSAAHATNLFVRTDDFEWRSGNDNLTHYKLPEAERFGTAFCRDCGSLMPKSSGEFVVIPAGGLDSDPGIEPAGYIYTDDKARWHAIHDELPQWAERPV